MPKFIVFVQEIHTVSVTVEAEDEQAAQAAAEEVITDGINQDGTDLNHVTEYAGTMPRSEWPVLAVK